MPKKGVLLTINNHTWSWSARRYVSAYLVIYLARYKRMLWKLLFFKTEQVKKILFFLPNFRWLRHRFSLWILSLQELADNVLSFSSPSDESYAGFFYIQTTEAGFYTVSRGKSETVREIFLMLEKAFPPSEVELSDLCLTLCFRGSRWQLRLGALSFEMARICPCSLTLATNLPRKRGANFSRRLTNPREL